MRRTTILLTTIFTCIAYFLSAQSSPYFPSGSDPKPGGKKWVKVDYMSDEFDGNQLDSCKWFNTDHNEIWAGWKGRPPGLFMENTVSVSGGELKMTNYQFDTPIDYDNKTWTHACGLVRSRTPHTYGYYECKMKSTKTFLSSTFWLVSLAEGDGCDRRVTELDIQECVGQVTGSWSGGGTRMNSNTHHRYWRTPAGCQPNASIGQGTDLSAKPYDRYFVYGVWWKNKDEALFYLDGVYQYTINLPSDFNLPMYLNMVSEAYDWNPTPSDGGIVGRSAADRTTSYQWVRSWKLEDVNSTAEDAVLSSAAPRYLPPRTSYDVRVPYEATQSRDIVVEFWSPSGYLGSGRKTVAAGEGITCVTVNLNSIPPKGNNYFWKTSIRPVGANSGQSLDNDQLNNVEINTPYSHEIVLLGPSTTVPSQTSYTVDVQYEAAQRRDVVVEFWSPSGYLGSGRKTVAAGTGVIPLTINLDNVPSVGSGHIWKAYICPVGENWQQNLDNDQVSNVTVISPYSDEVALSNAPTNVPSQTSYTVNVQYEASQSRDVVVEFWSSSSYLGLAKQTVSMGIGTAAVTINLNTAPNPGTGYIWKTYICPVGENWQQSLDNDHVNNVTVTGSSLIPDGKYALRNKANGEYLAAPHWPDSGNDYNAITVVPGTGDDQRWIFTHLGDDVYTIKLAASTRYLEVPYSYCGNYRNVATWTSANYAHQKWKALQYGEYFMFKPLHCPSHALYRKPHSGTSQSKGHDSAEIWAANHLNDNELWTLILNADAMPVTNNGESNNLATTSSQTLALVVHPNPVSPTSDWFIDLKMDSSQDVEISVFNVTGKQIYSEKYSNLPVGYTDIRIDSRDLNHLSKGIYLLKVQTPTIKRIQKVVVH